MSRHTLAATCLLLILVATPAGQVRAVGPCTSLGDPPEEPPHVATGCGPKIVVNVLIPAAGVDWSMDVGPCREDCDQTITIDVIVCSDWSPDPAFADPQQPIDGIWPTPESLMENALLAAGQLLRSFDGSPPGSVQMDTFLTCD